eukprot:6203253-Pleurochrysis_carterae.AAC.5
MPAMLGGRHQIASCASGFEDSLRRLVSQRQASPRAKRAPARTNDLGGMNPCMGIKAFGRRTFRREQRRDVGRRALWQRTTRRAASWYARGCS